MTEWIIAWDVLRLCNYMFAGWTNTFNDVSRAFARIEGTLSGLPFHCRRTCRRASALGKNVRPTRYFGSAGNRL